MISSGAFAITTTSTSVKLPANRTGQLQFTVTNTSGQHLTIRAVIVTPQGPQMKSWFVIDGQPERGADANGTVTFTVNITVPNDAPAGPVVVRMDALGVENTDAYKAQGPSVIVEVPPIEVKKKPVPWLIIALIALGVLVLAGGAGLAYHFLSSNGKQTATASPSPTPTPTPPNPIDKFTGTWTNKLSPGGVNRWVIKRQGNTVQATIYYDCFPTCKSVAQNGTFNASQDQLVFNFILDGTPNLFTMTWLSQGQLEVQRFINGFNAGSSIYTQPVCIGCFQKVPVSPPIVKST